MNRTKGIASIALLVALTTNTAQPQVATHDGCILCHLTDPPDPQGTLNAPIDVLCIGCHTDRFGAGEHPEGIPVSVPGALPLPDGVIRCTTCHDPHVDGLALRLAGDQLCFECHQL